MHRGRHRRGRLVLGTPRRLLVLLSCLSVTAAGSWGRSQANTRSATSRLCKCSCRLRWMAAPSPMSTSATVTTSSGSACPAGVRPGSLPGCPAAVGRPPCPAAAACRSNKPRCSKGAKAAARSRWKRARFSVPAKAARNAWNCFSSARGGGAPPVTPRRPPAAAETSATTASSPPSASPASSTPPPCCTATPATAPAAWGRWLKIQRTPLRACCCFCCVASGFSWVNGSRATMSRMGTCPMR